MAYFPASLSSGYLKKNYPYSSRAWADLGGQDAGGGPREVVGDGQHLHPVPPEVALPEARQRVLARGQRPLHARQVVQHRHAHRCTEPRKGWQSVTGQNIRSQS